MAVERSVEKLLSEDCKSVENDDIVLINFAMIIDQRISLVDTAMRILGAGWCYYNFRSKHLNSR